MKVNSTGFNYQICVFLKQHYMTSTVQITTVHFSWTSREHYTYTVLNEMPKTKDWNKMQVEKAKYKVIFLRVSLGWDCGYLINTCIPPFANSTFSIKTACLAYLNNDLYHILFYKSSALILWLFGLPWSMPGPFCSCSCFSHCVYHNSGRQLSSSSSHGPLLFSAETGKGEQRGRKQLMKYWA